MYELSFSQNEEQRIKEIDEATQKYLQILSPDVKITESRSSYLKDFLFDALTRVGVDIYYPHTVEDDDGEFHIEKWW